MLPIRIRRAITVALLTLAASSSASEAARTVSCATVPYGSELGSDFDGDGWNDLPVGAPLEDVGLLPDAGSVQVLYGSQNGLRTRDVVFTQDTPGMPGESEALDRWGASLASGDFDADGFCDLAIGAPGEDVGAVTDAGRVTILYGSGDGLTTRRARTFDQGAPGVPGIPEIGDQFAFSLVAHDFGKSAAADLAIGVPDEDVGDVADAGQIHVLYGSLEGLSSVGDDVVSQDAPGIKEAAEAEDRFGAVMTAGDIGKSARAELVVGVPLEDRSVVDAGVVHILYGGTAGLTDLDQLWHQDVEGVKGASESGGSFGYSLTMANFGSGSSRDLAIGTPGATVDDAADAGQVHVLYGNGDTLTAGDDLWTRASGTGLGSPAAGDLFGYRLASGQLWGTAQAELSISVPQGDIQAEGVDAGLVLTLSGTSAGLDDRFAVTTSSDDYQSPDPAEVAGERFGSGGLLIRQFGGPNAVEANDAELIVGSRFSGATWTVKDPGYIYIDYELQNNGDRAHRLSQDSPEIRGTSETSDQWGWVGSNHLETLLT